MAGSAMVFFAAVRALHFASLMCLWGGGLYLLLLKHSLGMEMPARPVQIAAIAGSVLALLTGVIWLLLVTGQMTGDWHAALNPQSVTLAATETRFGQIWLARLFGLVLLLGFAVLRRRIGLQTVVAGVVLAALGLVSHAAASSGGSELGHALNDAIHLLTAGFWVGGLVVLASLCRIHRHECDVLVGPFRLFSLWGVYAVAVLVITGGVNAACILPLRAITTRSAYADVLGIKIALALGMIALAAVNRSQLLPALRNGENEVVSHLKRNVAGEIALGLAVIVIVGYLGLMPPA